MTPELFAEWREDGLYELVRVLRILLAMPAKKALLSERGEPEVAVGSERARIEVVWGEPSGEDS